MSRVFVVDVAKRPVDPICPREVRRLLSRGQAAVWQHDPVTLILKGVWAGATPTPPRLILDILDPGSEATGLALVDNAIGRTVWAGEVAHRGQRVHEPLIPRSAIRRGRRDRYTRYRPAWYANRRRHGGWPPRFAAVAALSQDVVRFDTHLLQDAEISELAYQQGLLAGYAVCAYLVERWRRRCASCDATDVALQFEHITPPARSGSDRERTLTLACERCNAAKGTRTAGTRTAGTRTAADWGHLAVALRLRAPLRDGVVAVNTPHWALYQRLQATGMPVDLGTGRRTTWNRTGLGLPKAHWIEAACVGASTCASLVLCQGHPVVAATQKAPTATRSVGRFRTGDSVRAIEPRPSIRVGVHVGRLAVRAGGFCNIKTARETVHGIEVRLCQPLQRGAGYAYQQQEKGAAALPPRG